MNKTEKQMRAEFDEALQEFSQVEDIYNQYHCDEGNLYWLWGKAWQACQRLNDERLVELEQENARLREALEDAATEIELIIYFYHPDGSHEDDLSDSKKLLPRLKQALENTQ